MASHFCGLVFWCFAKCSSRYGSIFAVGPFFYPHPVSYRNRQIADERGFSFTLAQDKDTQRQTDEAMTVHIGPVCMAAWSCNIETASNFLPNFGIVVSSTL